MTGKELLMYSYAEWVTMPAHSRPAIATVNCLSLAESFARHFVPVPEDIKSMAELQVAAMFQDIGRVTVEEYHGRLRIWGLKNDLPWIIGGDEF